tara:strand:- start:203 stop:469 length:267 start_codon:yes stop_codon:yes gene_type:complete
MPSSKNYVRNYSMKGEGKYDKSPKRMADNRARKKARSLLERAGTAKRGDGKDVDHKNGNPRDNSPKNLRSVGRAVNRSIKRNKKAGKA